MFEVRKRSKPLEVDSSQVSLDLRICEAISQRQVVEVTYTVGQRVIEPYCHGHSSTGVELLRAFQVEGASASGMSVGWKLFKVEEIREIVVLNEKFLGVREDYNPLDPSMKVHCCIEGPLDL